MRRSFLVLILSAFAFVCFAGNATLKTAAQKKDNVRAPFELKLRFDKEHVYDQKVLEQPYVQQESVSLFCGDDYGINVKIENDEIAHITYQKVTAEADITFHFWQEVDKDGKQMMMCNIHNNLARKVYIKAVMTIPFKKGTYKTSIMPVEAGLSGIEIWGAHTIVQMVLYNFRFKGDKE